jgi:hypothetical protein
MGLAAGFDLFHQVAEDDEGLLDVRVGVECGEAVPDRDSGGRRPRPEQRMAVEIEHAPLIQAVPRSMPQTQSIMARP